MRDPTDASVVVCTHFMGIARTVRMALRGMNVRNVTLAANREQMLEAFENTEPDCLMLYVDSEDPADDGLQHLSFIRRDEASPNHKIPVIVVSPRRDLPTINAVMNGGAHGYALFPASGEVLLSKITAARVTRRAWVERPDYIGPERKIDREAAEASEAPEAGEKEAGEKAAV